MTKTIQHRRILILARQSIDLMTTQELLTNLHTVDVTLKIDQNTRHQKYHIDSKIKQPLNILTREIIYLWIMTDARYWLNTLFLCDLVLFVWHYDYCVIFKGPIVLYQMSRCNNWLIWYYENCVNFKGPIIPCIIHFILATMILWLLC